MYNSCIDGDNILFPHSNYRKCFSEFNTLYVCSNIKRYNKKERDICANFVLPSLAFVNQKKSIYGKAPKFYCEGYESHIIKNYNNHLKEIGEKEEYMDNKIEFIEKVKKNNNELRILTEGLLGELIGFNVKIE